MGSLLRIEHSFSYWSKQKQLPIHTSQQKLTKVTIFDHSSVLIGIVQLVIYRPRLKYLDSLSRKMWRVRENETSTAVYEKLQSDETD